MAAKAIAISFLFGWSIAEVVLVCRNAVVWSSILFCPPAGTLSEIDAWIDDEKSCGSFAVGVGL